MIEKIVEYVVMGIIALSGWGVAMGRRVLASYIMEKASTKFVSKELYDNDVAQMKESLRVIDTKIDRLMEA